MWPFSGRPKIKCGDCEYRQIVEIKRQEHKEGPITFVLMGRKMEMCWCPAITDNAVHCYSRNWWGHCKHFLARGGSNG